MRRIEEDSKINLEGVKRMDTLIDYLTKAADLVDYIFKLVNNILVAVNGEEDETVAEMENTKKTVSDIVGAVKDFADQVEDLK